MGWKIFFRENGCAGERCWPAVAKMKTKKKRWAGVLGVVRVVSPMFEEEAKGGGGASCNDSIERLCL